MHCNIINLYLFILQDSQQQFLTSPNVTQNFKSESSCEEMIP